MGNRGRGNLWGGACRVAFSGHYIYKNVFFNRYKRNSAGISLYGGATYDSRTFLRFCKNFHKPLCPNNLNIYLARIY